MFAPLTKIHGVLFFSQLILAQSIFGKHGEKKMDVCCLLHEVWQDMAIIT